MLTITKEKVLEAASKCVDARRTLEILFPEVFEVDKTVKVTDVASFLCIRTSGKFKHKSFYLDDVSWTWSLENDETGQLCLVPRRK